MLHVYSLIIQLISTMVFKAVLLLLFTHIKLTFPLILTNADLNRVVYSNYFTRSLRLICVLPPLEHKTYDHGPILLVPALPEVNTNTRLVMRYSSLGFS
jgi:hypothetical protein